MAFPVTHFEINAQDAAATQKFYQDLFGWGIDTNNPMNYGLIDTKAKGHGINGGIGASQSGRSWITFYVETEDPSQTLAKAERLGGRTVMQPMDMGPGVYALFSDPEGNVIGLYKSAPEAVSRAQENGGTRARATARRKAAPKRATASKRATARKRTSTKKTSTRSKTRRSRG